ncbi:leucine rich adaptor protein 1-like [Nerophis ophidion]|uniref:leucine rich adaptor protein 1-like n=1 Tax=Nerophis ophidion TaxID=159077 RepID=UPI002AE03770|nr:leucine rich adaptor protein 1-like [Nerophis ophidion]
MADEDSEVYVTFPHLKELEGKVGRKTPESLLLWMREDVDSDVGETEDRRHPPDDLSSKLSILKQEMRWLRSADVRILRQLVSVHEGIEAMRWLMLERATLASCDSSLTGSLSSLVTAEEHGPSISPCRDIPRSTYPENPPGSFNGESSDGALHAPADHSDRGSAEESPSNFSDSQGPCSDTLPSLGIKTCADPIGGVLLQRTTTPRDVRADEKLQVTHVDTTEEDEKMATLFGYDARWCWVESRDDVTYL